MMMIFKPGNLHPLKQNKTFHEHNKSKMHLLLRFILNATTFDTYTLDSAYNTLLRKVLDFSRTRLLSTAFYD